MKKQWLFCLLLLTGCQQKQEEAIQNKNIIDVEFSAIDLDVGYDESSIHVLDLNGDVMIQQAGVYLLRGEAIGQVCVDVKDDEIVQLVFDNVVLEHETSAAIYVKNASKVILTTAQNSINQLVSKADFTQAKDNVDSVIFSKSDLVLNGEGKLILESEGHGIVSKDKLIIGSGSYEITAAGHAISGQDCIKINAGTFSLQSQKDAIQSDHEDADKGYVYIKNGDFDIISDQDGIQASSALQIDQGNFIVHTKAKTTDESTKGLKSNGSIQINGGNFELVTEDDAIHGANDVVIEHAWMNIKSSDDGIHSDERVVIESGEVIIDECYEGIEGAQVIVNGGHIEILAQDDGINATASKNQEEIKIEIMGGEIIIDAQGDGMDSNGSLYINGGEIMIHGSTSGNDAAIDYDKEALINKGVLLGVGTSQMAAGFGNDSEQVSLVYSFDKIYEPSKITIYDEQKNELISFQTKKSFSCLNLSFEELKLNETYTIQVNEDRYEFCLDAQSDSNRETGNGMHQPPFQHMPPSDGGMPNENQKNKDMPAMKPDGNEPEMPINREEFPDKK